VCGRHARGMYAPGDVRLGATHLDSSTDVLNAELTRHEVHDGSLAAEYRLAIAVELIGHARLTNVIEGEIRHVIDFGIFLSLERREPRTVARLLSLDGGEGRIVRSVCTLELHSRSR